jgi:hypothetical protein
MEIEYDNQVLIVRNFISQDECDALNSWVDSAIEEDQFVEGVTGDWDKKEFSITKKRLTNRMSEKIEYCSLVYAIQQKLRESFPAISNSEVIKNHGKDGVVVSVTYNDGDVYKHKDPSVGEGLSGARFNILSSKAESGGLIHVEDKTYELNEGDLMAYLVTDLYHSVDVCNGNNPRILFMFGFCVPQGSKLA